MLTVLDQVQNVGQVVEIGQSHVHQKEQAGRPSIEVLGCKVYRVDELGERVQCFYVERNVSLACRR